MGLQVNHKHVVETIAEMEENIAGEKPSERTVQKYIQIARELPRKVKESLKSVPGDAFGGKHARIRREKFIF